MKINRKYTHFAVNKSDGKIYNGWEYGKELDKSDILYYSKGDLKDMDLNIRDFSILTKRALITKGVDPFNPDNWYKIKFAKGGVMKRTKKSIEQDKSIKAKKGGRRVSESGNVYYENRPNKSDKDLRKKFAKGGSTDAPSIYVADLEAYNNGKLIGEWLDLSDFNDGSEVMDAINEMLEKWSKEQGETKEEYAIHDYENFPSNFYSEYMGERDFDKVIEFYKASEETGIPQDVIQGWLEQTGNDDASSIQDAYQGSAKSESDFAYDLVQDIGMPSNPEYYLYVSDTDRRLVAGEEYDRVKEDLESEGELSEEEIEARADEVYDEWYEGLNDPYYFLVEEQGIYDSESILKASFVQFDYDKFADDLFINDYTSIKGKDGDVYVFTNYYKAGGEVKKYKKGGQVKKDETQEKIDKLKKVVSSKHVDESVRAKAQAAIDMLEEKRKKESKPKTKPASKKKPAKVAAPKKAEKKAPKAKEEPKKATKKIKRTKKSEPKKVAKKVKRTKSKPKVSAKKIKKGSTYSVKYLNGSSKTSIDKKENALKPGKRISKSGNTYYEYRANRADLNAKKKLEKGGELN